MTARVGLTVCACREQSVIAAGHWPLGYAIMSLGLGESPATRHELLSTITELLPSNRLRYAAGVHSLSDIVLAVSSGVDAVDSSLVNELSNGGKALVFDVDCNGSSEGVCQQEPLDLRSASCARNKGPILEGCECSTCSQGFSRGYIHHLLNCNEMLAEVLLEAHNTHHMMLFFESIRKSIERGKFDEYKSKLLSHV